MPPVGGRFCSSPAACSVVCRLTSRSGGGEPGAPPDFGPCHSRRASQPTSAPIGAWAYLTPLLFSSQVSSQKGSPVKKLLDGILMLLYAPPPGFREQVAQELRPG